MSGLDPARRAALIVAFGVLASCGGVDRTAGTGGAGGTGGTGGSGPEVPPEERLSQPLPAPAVPAWPPPPDQVPRFELTLDPLDLAALEADPESDELRPARLRAPGYEGEVWVRYRGASSRTLPKKSLRIEFPEGVRYAGRHKVNLLAGWLDGGYLGERIAADLAWALGATVSATTFVSLSVNGVPSGLYLEMERVDKNFLRARGLDPDANLYREGGRNGELRLGPPSPWQQDFEKKTNEDRADPDLAELLERINRTPEHDLASTLDASLDLDGYLAVLAVQNLISAVWVEDTRGYWIAEHGGARWTYAPWDLNNSLLLYWRTWGAAASPRVDRPVPVFTAYDGYLDRNVADRSRTVPGYRPAWSVLATRIFDEPTLRARLLEKLEAGLELLADGAFVPYVEGLATAVAPAIAEDPHAEALLVAGAAEWYAAYARGRVAFLQAALPALAEHGTTEPVVIDRVGEGWVELVNRGSAPVSLAGYRLVTDLRAPFAGPLDEEPVLSAGGVVRIEAPLAASGGEVGLHRGESYGGYEDLLYVGPLAPGASYGRTPSGAESYGPR